MARPTQSSTSARSPARAEYPLTIEDFDQAAREVPVLADVAPIGRHNIAALDAADARAAETDIDATANVIRPWSNPVTTVPAFTALRGNLAPDGAVLKTAAARTDLTHHTGPAVVFHGYLDMLSRIDDPALDVTEESVLVLTGCGPRGGDGFPEWGKIPIPKKLAGRGVTDMLRISDARMSGTSFGTCVLHVAPEAAVGGPLAAVEDGDLVTIDVSRRLLEVDVCPELLAERLGKRSPRPVQHRRGWPALYQEHVQQASQGADLDFLVPRSGEELPFVDPTIGRS